MKKLGILLFTIMLLGGCMSSNAVRVVEDMYRKVMMEDERVEGFFSKQFMEANAPFDEYKDKLYSDVIEREGVALMHLKELSKNQMNTSLVEELDLSNGDHWHFVVAQVDDDHVMLWVVQRGERQYTIVDGKEMHVDEYRNYILD